MKKIKNKKEVFKWIVLLVAVLLVTAAIIVGLTFNWNSDKTTDVPPDPPATDDEGDLIVGEGTANRLLLASVSQSDNILIFTATVKDNDGGTAEIFQVVDWTLTWATEKSAMVSDFVTLSVDGITATLTCKQSFDTQMILTCISQLDSVVKATATIDYNKRVINTSGRFCGTEFATYDGGTVNVSFPNYTTVGTNHTWLEKSLFFYSSASFGIGSIGGTVTMPEYTVTANENFKAALKNANGSLIADGTISVGGSVSAGTQGHSLSEFCEAFGGSIFVPNYGYAFFKALSETDNQFTVSVTIGYANGGTYKATYTLNIEATFVAVDGVELDKNSGVF